MTFTSPAPGRRVSRVARWTRPAAALAALAVLAFPGVATAATDDEPDEVVSLSVAPDDRGIVSRTQPVRLTVTAANGGDQPLAAGDVSVQRGERRLVSAAAVDDWLSDGAAPGAFEEIATADLGAVPAGDATQEAISVDPADAGTDALTPGVYPVRAVFEAGDERLRARTVIVVPRTSTAGGSVGVIVPITAGARAAGVIDAETLAELTGPDGDLRAQLDAVTTTPAILAVDPAIPASIRALGRSAPADAVAWLDELLALPNDRFALQYGDADLAAQVGAGATSPLEVTSFAPYLDPADFTGVEGDEDTATPDPSATPGAPVLPSLDELLDVGAARDAVYWPATGTAGVETVRALSAVVDTDDRPVTIVPSSVVRGDAAARATVDDADVLVYDAELSALLEDASAAESEAERAALLAQVSARSTFTPASDPLLVTVDRAGGRSAAALRDAPPTCPAAPTSASPACWRRTPTRSRCAAWPPTMPGSTSCASSVMRRPASRAWRPSWTTPTCSSAPSGRPSSTSSATRGWTTRRAGRRRSLRTGSASPPGRKASRSSRALPSRWPARTPPSSSRSAMICRGRRPSISARRRTTPVWLSRMPPACPSERSRPLAWRSP